MSKPTLPDLTPLNSYLIFAFSGWLQANGLRAFIVVDGRSVTDPFLKSSIKGGVLTLNITDSAVVDLQITDEVLSFGARFNGAHRTVSVPTEAVLLVTTPDRADIQLGLPPMGKRTDPIALLKEAIAEDIASDIEEQIELNSSVVVPLQSATVTQLRPNNPFKIVPKD